MAQLSEGNVTLTLRSLQVRLYPEHMDWVTGPPDEATETHTRFESDAQSDANVSNDLLLFDRSVGFVM